MFALIIKRYILIFICILIIIGCDCLEKCVEKSKNTNFLCNGICQSVLLPCNGICPTSHSYKCPNEDFCVASDPTQLCSNPVGNGACPGFRHMCENFEKQCPESPKG